MKLARVPDKFSIRSSLKTFKEFRISLRSLPYLADHGFLEMVVLPGSFYVETALSLYMEHEGFNSVPCFVRKVEFRSPVILSSEDTLIKVEVTERGDEGIEYTFYETETDALVPARQYAARLEIGRNVTTPSRADDERFSIQTFQARSHEVIEQHRFYRTLRESGNEYGPRFQRVSSIWRAGNESLGQLNVSQLDQQIEGQVVGPTLLDSITQLLAPFIIEKEQGKPFVLRAIEKVEILDVNFPLTLWGHSGLAGSDDGKGLVGNVRIFDESGKTYLKCDGITLSLLDNFEGAQDKPETTLAIAANFTAEPLEDSVNFWGDYFGKRIKLEFAPYNQLFQQLLDSGSAFRKNIDGVNVILLSLDEWLAADRPVLPPLNRTRADQYFQNFSRYLLPNDLEIVHLNQYETEYLYKEIFEDQCYLRHGISLHDGDTVVDIGANIGLFSLFAMSHCRDLKIYAFEPAPMAYELLKANCEAYGSNVHAMNAGVSDQSKTAMLTFYEKSSVFSGFHADETEDRDAIRAIVRSMLKRATSADRQDLDAYVDELTADRLSRQMYQCQMTSVSDLIRDEHIDRINLLKIDAEKSELEIIAGIEDSDWTKIDQLVLEIHDPTRETVKRIEDLLTRKGFKCVIAQEQLLEQSGLFNLYATRVEAAHEVSSRPILQRNVEDFCTALKSFMTETTTPLVLCVCPSAPSNEGNANLKEVLHDAEQSLISKAGAIANVHTIGSETLLQLYPVTDYYDSHSRHLGHIPFTPACYAAIGTALSRTIFNLNRPPYKVIVLDCDDTLWNGVCAEVGPLGVEVGPAHRGLQEFMVDQMNSGKLLCLCSKNNENDAMAVFDQRSDMILKRDHLVSWRINWKSKSENIRSLADELNLGLDSFIFIDDNPVDCADVRINLPGVLSLQTPRQSSSISSFLKHLWAFDCTGPTEEDRARTQAYQENAKREQFHQQTLSLKDFIDGLQLHVEISEAVDDQLARVSQLTFRTNQFNFTTIRRHENEIRDFLRRDDAKCLAVRVVDRFGDYGLVGVVMYEAKASAYEVDTFLLSCRVLGRGVEYAVLSNLGKRALMDNKEFVELTCVPTDRNSPAMSFINSVADQFGNDTGTHWTIPVAYLANLKYQTDDLSQNKGGRDITASENGSKFQRVAEPDVVELSGRLQTIAENLSNIDQISKAIEENRLKKQPGAFAEEVPMATPLQTSVLDIWRRALDTSRIGINDNFFEVGGTSLKAVQVIAMLKKELNRNLSIVSLFEYPTVALLATKLSASEDTTRGKNLSEAVLRGQNRRTKALRRATH